MSSKNPRINVTFDKKALKTLEKVASKDHMSLAGLVRTLTMEALENREDYYLSNMAEKIDKKGAKTYSHEDAWR
tara:strand:+ start:4206 stop:4427 length:222 start_codon:yes stop_codon:yes gene_type:complete